MFKEQARARRLASKQDQSNPHVSPWRRIVVSFVVTMGSQAFQEAFK
jgi:hypothetical protein